MTHIGTFPFGQPVRILAQEDRTPKRIFVLGVYASAVHACWINSDGKSIVTALAVASEPYIFWRGEGTESIIQQIAIPPELGRLVAAARQYNGPSGIALDDLFLKPLGCGRTDAWLCDLVPHSCVNPSQQKAIDRAYLPKIQPYKLVTPNVPTVPLRLTDEKRRAAIWDEVCESNAEVLILLGDKPIQWFLAYFDKQRKRLADFGRDSQSYGRLHSVLINGKNIAVLPLAHPRQVARLGQSSVEWYKLHQIWVKEFAPDLLR
jgi:hypothetical protein